MPIVDDGSNFQDSAPALFGTEFAKKSKDLVDQVKAMRVPLTSRREQKPFFFEEAPPSGRGDTARGMGGAELPNCTQEGFETGSSFTGRSSNQDLPADQPRSETSRREKLTCKITCGELPNRKSCKNPNSCIGDITTSRKVLASWTAASLSEQLEVVNKGSLGPRNSTGYCIEFVAEPYQNKRPHPPVYPLDQTQLISTELGELLQKGAIVEILNPQGGGLLSSIPCTEKRWWTTSSHQPQSPESVRSGITLQNGRDTLSEGDTKARRLASKSRPEGCLFYYSHSCSPQKVSPVHVPGESV